MALPSTYLLDILSGKKVSSFILLEDFTPFTSCSYIWPTLLKRLCENYSCLVVCTELPGSTPPCSIPSDADVISFWDFDSIADLFKGIESKIASRSSSSRSWVIFFENLDALLNDCPSDRDIADWSRLILSFMLSLATNLSVASIVCSLNLYKAPNGEISYCSEQIKEIFEFSASTCIQPTSILSPTQIQVSFWHRRTLDSVYKAVRLCPSFPPTNKPSISGLCQLTLDSYQGTIISCFSVETSAERSDVEVMPTSTFKLTVSKEEMEAKKQVVLPYMSAINDSSASDIKIVYEPDEFDDLDDEDPDDDLDI